MVVVILIYIRSYSNEPTVDPKVYCPLFTTKCFLRKGMEIKTLTFRVSVDDLIVDQDL